MVLNLLLQTISTGYARRSSLMQLCWRSFFLLTAVGSFTPAISNAASCIDKPNTLRHVAEVCYDGSHFSGWQLQPDKRSVQGTLNDVLSERYQHPVRVAGASRTDKGVHARGQIIHFDLPASLSDEVTIQSLSGLNQQLPDDIKFKRWSIAPQGLLDIQIQQGLPWHAGENAVSKHYSFIFSTCGGLRDPMMIKYRADLHNYKAVEKMSIDRFQDALNVFKGTHDFKAFGNRLDIRAKKSEEHSGEVFSSVRTIFSADVVEKIILVENSPISSLSLLPGREEENAYFRVDIVLDGALYKMIRNIIAGCVQVGYGTMCLEELRLLLGNTPSLLGNTPSLLGNTTTLSQNTPSRAENRLVTAPACGLYLEEVFYREKLFS
jgi:tRNA pseudouridine(38-40) synthase